MKSEATNAAADPSIIITGITANAIAARRLWVASPANQERERRVRCQMRRNTDGSSEENAEGRTAFEEQLTQLEWAVEDGEQYLRVEKRKGKLLMEELAASEREKTALSDENRQLTKDNEILQVYLEAE